MRLGGADAVHALWALLLLLSGDNECGLKGPWWTLSEEFDPSGRERLFRSCAGVALVAEAVLSSAAEWAEEVLGLVKVVDQQAGWKAAEWGNIEARVAWEGLVTRADACGLQQ